MTAADIASLDDVTAWVKELLAYCWHAEHDDWQQAGEPGDGHIFLTMRSLDAWAYRDAD